MAAEKVVWTLRAINDKIRIYRYWNKHNKSNLYSIKLEELFEAAVDFIVKYPKQAP